MPVGQEEFRFGEGKLVVALGVFDGIPAVIIGPSKFVGEVGSSAERERWKEDGVPLGCIILQFPTAEKAKAVADVLVGEFHAAPATEPKPAFCAMLTTGICDLAAENARLREAIQKALGDPEAHGIGEIDSPESHLAYVVSLLTVALEKQKGDAA